MRAFFFKKREISEVEGPPLKIACEEFAPFIGRAPACARERSAYLFLALLRVEENQSTEEKLENLLEKEMPAF